MNSNLNDSFGLIKFGEESWLKNIKNGKLWFRTLEYYQEYEDHENIGDKDEGISHIIYPDSNTKIYFSHPFIENGRNIDISNLNGPFHLFPRYNRQLFILCLSYFSIDDIIQKSIFDDKILEEKKWVDTFFFLDPENFISLIKDTLKKHCPEISIVQYVDYTKNQESLNYFKKSNIYNFQKEIRIAFRYFGEKNGNITRIDKDTLEVNLEKAIYGIIIPSISFREGFKVENV